MKVAPIAKSVGLAGDTGHSVTPKGHVKVVQASLFELEYPDAIPPGSVDLRLTEEPQS